MKVQITAYLFRDTWYYYVSIPGEGSFEEIGERGFEMLLSRVESIKTRLAIEAFWTAVEAYFQKGQQMQLELDEEKKKERVRIGVANEIMTTYESFADAVRALTRTTTNSRL